MDASSIATTSVVSSVGSIHNCGSVGGAHDAMGQLTISPDGNKIVNALTCQDKFEFFDFNQTTGVVSNSISIVGNGGSAWGTAFSPDSKKVYVNSIFGASVFQYDISVFTSAAILSSLTNVYNTGSGGYKFGYMELGPDGKIYIPRPNTAFISVVNSPNLAGAACNFSYTGISTGSVNALWGTSRIAYNIPTSYMSPTFSLIPTSLNVTCNNTSNGSATITPNTAGTYSYNWQPGNQSTSSISNLTPGIYTVTVSNACGSTTSAITISLQPTPTLSISNPTACIGSTVNVTAATVGGSPTYSYTWSQGTSTTNLVNINAAPGILTCTVTDSQGCQATSSTSITITNSSVSNFLHSINSCKGILTTTNTSIGASQNLWYFGDGSTSTQTSPSYTYSLPGTYTISLVTNPIGGCKDSTSQSVTILNPTQSLYTFTNVACDSIVLITNTSIGATTYLWDFGDGNTSTLVNPGSHGYSNLGTYTITLITNPGSNCADTLKQIVTLSKNVISQFNVSTSPCSMSVSPINTSSLATTYSWNFGDGFSSTLNNPSHIYSATGNYTISLIANPGTFCADTTYQNITITGVPTALFSYIKDPCSAIVTFTNNSINATSYQWNFGGANSSNITHPVFDFNHPGTYTISLIANPGLSCADTIVQSITINYMGVVADFTYQNPQYTNEVYFTNLSQNAIKFDWIFGDGTAVENVFEPSHTYDLMGEFTVCLRATNTIGCDDIICKKIKVDSDWTLYLPDAFHTKC
ncbi:MAG: PKD domain-containing protein [Sphingobacteriaceae bacterium]|nr:PKD domain-containing protein [Sphingobacteriaceae bacterium]